MVKVLVMQASKRIGIWIPRTGINTRWVSEHGCSSVIQPQEADTEETWRRVASRTSDATPPSSGVSNRKAESNKDSHFKWVNTVTRI